MLKTRPIILRIHSSKKKDYREGIYSEFLLFCPWRNEKELRAEFDQNCEEMFTKYEKVIKANKNSIYPNAPMIDTMVEMLETNENTKPTHLYETIDETAQQEDGDDTEEMDETNPIDTSDLPAEKGNGESKAKPDGCPYKPIVITARDEMIQQARNLSFSQRIVFDKVITFCKSIITAERSGNPNSMADPPRLIVHGGGGVGKSYLIQTISQWGEKILRDGNDR